jgi:acetyl-CoA carboxylase biotin carboxyl carrier protein
MDLRKLKKLIDLVEESSITELEINDAEEKVRIVKTAAAPWRTMPTPVAGPPAPVAAAPATVTAHPACEPEVPEGDAVKAPMVGTFYRAASPGAEAFVEVGSSVKPARRCASLKR